MFLILQICNSESMYSNWHVPPSSGIAEIFHVTRKITIELLIILKNFALQFPQNFKKIVKFRIFKIFILPLQLNF